MTTKPIKINEKLRKSRPISNLAGSWKMNDKKARNLLTRIKKGWNL